MRQDSCSMASAMEEEREGRKSEKVLKLFGVSIVRGEVGGMEEAADGEADAEEEEVMRKSSSMGNLASCATVPLVIDHGAGDQGYHSDGAILQSATGRRRRYQERKRDSMHLRCWRGAGIGEIIFAGDSISRNQWESFLCMLAKAVQNKSSIKHKGFLSIVFHCLSSYRDASSLIL
ncbi:uncharacterized protein LOC135586345 [Musa acuminata AAA Group]|uniref:uncharacterized protein LOC135586345 n=1 Tax=Musa acuminata AAA Group TaxID=214697 RepID=UPI0031D74550